KSYLELKEQDNEFDIESIIVFNQLKLDFKVGVCDKTLYHLNRKNPSIKNEETFNHIKEEVHDTISNYTSVSSIYNNGEDIEKYKESD
ncbi:14302_t:CDS:1, partial [Cetraspora pellucida]